MEPIKISLAICLINGSNHTCTLSANMEVELNQHLFALIFDKQIKLY